MGRELNFYLVLLLSGYCVAGPVRDDAVVPATSSDDVCSVKNETYARGDVVPDVAPCETCVCEPPDVKCSVAKCQINNGCRIIQQSGKCCPEYKCDCEHEGKLYNNGEKLDNPTSPCQVCYCRGGEIMCNSITCYRRDDCEPQHVEGQCCPKYGHCPPKNSSSVVAVPADPNDFSTKREMQPWLLTKSVYLQTTETSKYPQTIKIVEILPTQAPARAGEASLVPRIITNGSPESKSTSSLERVTESYSESSSVSAELNASMKTSVAGVEESAQPDSETYTTLLPHMADVTTTYEELSALVSAATEGTGYDIETGGTFFPQSTKDDDSSEESKEKTDNSSEEHNDTTSSPLENTTVLQETKQSELIERQVGENQTFSTTMELENTGKEEDDSPENTEPTSPSEVSAASSEETSKFEGVVTKHGLTIPPILNLNHQLHHLTLGGTGEEMEDQSVVRIGVYDPMKPGEKSNLVTVIKNEDTSSSSGEIISAESATTQILLTPQDLKTLAEMIIKEKIKAPNEKIVDAGTTPLTTVSYEETTSSVVSPVESTVGESKSSPATVEETTPSTESKSTGVKPHNLTKEEEKAQAVIDRLTSNILQPLQGIELVEANDTTTTDLPVEEVLAVGSSLQPGNKDAEWVEVSNSTHADKTDKIVEGETSPEEDDTATVRSGSVEDFGESTTESPSSSTVVSVTIGETGKPRGSLRQMDDTKESSDRRTRVTVNEDMSKHASIASLDENDRILVENFFKKTLDFQ